MIQRYNFYQTAISYEIVTPFKIKCSATGKISKLLTENELLYSHLYLTYFILPNKSRTNKNKTKVSYLHHFPEAYFYILQYNDLAWLISVPDTDD